MTEDKVIAVERDTFEKDGRTYFSYFIKGKVRGKDVRVLIVPPDKGGYTVLDIVFGEAMAAELVLRPYEIKDEASGKVITGNSYAVRSVDEDGIVYECPIKPYRQSDKALLQMLLRKEQDRKREPARKIAGSLFLESLNLFQEVIYELR